jgi:large subunit ribosomal protein L15
LEKAFDANSLVTKDVLLEKGLIKSCKGALLKILGTGKLSKKLTIQADSFSKSAVKAIEDCGGEARVIKES